MLCHVLWQIITKVLERLTASISRAEEGVEYPAKDHCEIFEVLVALTMKITVIVIQHYPDYYQHLKGTCCHLHTNYIVLCPKGHDFHVF